MTTTIQALRVIEEELIESHSRCHYPYTLTTGPASIGEPPGVEAGVYVTVSSEVYGRIAGVSRKTLSEALRATASELLETQATRWPSERQAMTSKQKKSNRIG